ncbi:ion channel domain-containing protein [Phthorimaea operculella]|nr:ion channel domain-containing protein [Phthorimaea operculella]
MNYCFTNLGMLGQIFLYLVPGFLFFIFLPACIFVIFEGWDFVASIYYAFVTLTTIGFGDLVAGTVNNGFKSGYFFTYQIFLIVWITFGLGYIVMLLGFITSGMRSESVHRIEQKIASQFKSTQNRILQGFTRDVNVIRKLINEANLIKIKPIYVDVAPMLSKSASCPNFTFDIEPRGPICGRKRANSENIHLSAKDMLRIQSDTDLLGIDKEKTFSAQAIVKPAELLARVVNVLGGIDPQQQQNEKGVHMFDDDQILASEKPPIFTIGPDIISSPYAARNRALSVAVPCYRKESVTKFDHDLTWTNGDTAEKYQREANFRSGKLSLPNNFIPPEEIDLQNRNRLTNLFNNQPTTENPSDLIKNSMKERVNQAQEVSEPVVTEKPKRRGSIFAKLGFGQKKDSSEEEEDTAKIKAYQQKKRHSIFPTFDFSEDDDEEDAAAARAYREKTRSGRKSIFPKFDLSFSEDEEEDDTAKRYKETTKHTTDELEAYKNKTKKGRLSLFPTFGKDKERKKSSGHEEISDLEASIRQFQLQNSQGRGSLLPEDNDSQDSDLERYKNKTKRGRGSLFDPDVNIAELPQSQQVEVLEQTSVADLLRALALLETTGQGQASASPSSLLELLGQSAPAPTPAQLGRRRGSIRPADFVLPPIPTRIEKPQSKPDSTPTSPVESTTPKFDGTQSEDSSAGPRRRRTSGRLNAAQFTPTLATVVAGAELHIPTATAARESRMTMLQQPPPPYSETPEEPHTPKARRYSPAPMDHSRPSTGPVPRLFSRLRKESSINVPDEESSRRGSLTDIVIDSGKDQT